MKHKYTKHKSTALDIRRFSKGIKMFGFSSNEIRRNLFYSTYCKKQYIIGGGKI